MIVRPPRTTGIDTFVPYTMLFQSRNVRDTIVVGKGAGGDIQIEWAYGGSGSALDAMLESVLFNAFAAADTGSTTLSVGSTTTFTRAAGSFIDDGFPAGDRITSSGFTTADRKSVVSGKSVSVRVDIGGSRRLKKKKKIKANNK